MLTRKRMLLMRDRLADFTPKQIGGLRLWLESNHGALSDGASQFTAANSETLSIADNASVSLSATSFTITAWALLDTITGVGDWRGILRKRDGTQKEYGFGVTASNDAAPKLFYGSVHAGAAETTVKASTFGIPSTSTWYFVVFIHDDANDELKISVNDGAFNTAAFSSTVNDSNGTLEIGRLDTHWNGGLANIGLWKKVLSAAEITSLYNAGSGMAYNQLSGSLLTSLVDYWDLDEPSGTRVGKHAGNNLTDNNTVTAVNGPGTHTATDGAAVKQWNDMSGLAHNGTQSTAANKPTWQATQVTGKNTVQFVSTNSHNLSIADHADLDLDDVMTIIAVTRPDNTAAEKSLLCKGTGAYYLGVDSSENFFLAKSSSTFIVSTSTSALSTTGWNIIAAVKNGATTNLYMNGTDVTGAVTDYTMVNTATALLVGSRVLLQFYDGDIATVLLFNRPLDLGERNLVTRWLGQRYGIGVS